MKPLYIASAVGALILALIYRPEWISTLIIIAIILALTTGLAVVITAHMTFSPRSNSSTLYSKTTPQLEAMRKYFTELEPKIDRPLRLPVVFGRMIDGILQQLIDLILRDYVGVWCSESGFKSDELIQDLKVDLWHVTKNLQERLSKVDQTRLVAVDMVNIVTQHFERIRVAQASATDGKLLEFDLSLHLLSSERERDYLRRVSERCIALLFPPNYVQNTPVKHLLREILACKVFYPVIEMITDPDSINQKILSYIQQQSQSETLRKKSYAYAASFEDFIKMIKDCNDTEELKHIRYNIVTEIMQATTIQNLKKSKGLDPDKEVFSFGTGKGDMLQARQVKRYINQLTYGKSQCEKRLRLLGWMGYPVEEAVEASTMITRKVLTLQEVLESVVGRRYLTQFLEQVGSQSLMGYWGAVEELRQSSQCNWHQLGAEIFYTYINTPSPDIKVDKQVKLSLDEAMEELSYRLDQRRQIRARKRSLQSLARVQSSLNKWSVLLNLDVNRSGGIVKRLQDPGLVERAASEFNQLQFCISKCENDLPEAHKQRAEQIRDLLTSSLDGMFLMSLHEKDSEGMARCLRIYVTLDKIADVEALFRREVVSPTLHEVISETSLQSDPRGLQGVYSRVLSFIDTHMEQLLKLTARGVGMPAVKGFDFLVNSFWPEVEQRLELHLPSIYAPGNPEMFYQRYCETMEFLEKLERYCGTQIGVKRLHSHPQYVAFLQRWNLPVYFQIRFQEIAGALENVMIEGSPRILSGGLTPADFQLQTTASAWNCLMRCWADGVFLHQLTHRFWKLNLQILGRYYTWIGEALEEKWPSDNMASNSGASSSSGDATNSSRLQFLVHLYTDVEKLVARLPNLLDSVTMKLSSLSQQGQDLLKSSLKDSEQQLLSRLPLITQFILGEVSGQSLPHLRQVSDIPRLFRRTNREMPTKPCSYVAQVIALPLSFHQTQKLHVKSELLEEWLTLTFSAITQQFYSSVDDVLTSVQKTEESLRRLKKIRDRSAAAASSETKGVGDDDKIRQQLLLDVYSYCEGVESAGIARKSVDKLDELVTLVEAARTKSDTSK